MPTELVTARQLRAAGASRAAIRRALETGTLLRPRRGWYATPSVPAPIIAACRVGGALSCISALHLAGAWVLDPAVLHVRVSSGVDVTRARRTVVHWTAKRVPPGVDSLDDALLLATTCLDFRALVVAVDSLAHRRILSAARIHSLLSGSARGRRALAAHDRRCESGIETLVRLGLRRLRIVIRTQVQIAGIGRVDFLIGDRLVVEADGYEWHADPVAFERDRARDRELVRRGYVVVRASYRQVLDDLDEVVLAVRDVIGRRDHRWRAVHRTQLSRSGYLVDPSSINDRDRES
jgi:very-short-patch-repair endonuclease